MEPVVEGALGPVRLKNYHRCCRAEDACMYLMNNGTAEARAGHDASIKELKTKLSPYNGKIHMNKELRVSL